MKQTRDILYTFNFSEIWHTVKCAKFQIILVTVSEIIFDLNIANSLYLYEVIGPGSEDLSGQW